MKKSRGLPTPTTNVEMRRAPITGHSLSSKRRTFLVENPHVDTDVKIQTPHWQRHDERRLGKLSVAASHTKNADIASQRLT